MVIICYFLLDTKEHSAVTLDFFKHGGAQMMQLTILCSCQLEENYSFHVLSQSA